MRGTAILLSLGLVLSGGEFSKDWGSPWGSHTEQPADWWGRRWGEILWWTRTQHWWDRRERGAQYLTYPVTGQDAELTWSWEPWQWGREQVSSSERDHRSDSHSQESHHIQTECYLHNSVQELQEPATRAVALYRTENRESLSQLIISWSFYLGAWLGLLICEFLIETMENNKIV